MVKIAVVRVRGIRKLHPKMKHVLELLRLYKPNHCVLVDDTPAIRGMLRIVKDYITFGAVNEKTVFRLLYKRGECGGKRLRELKKKEEIQASAKKLLTAASKEVDPVFRLRPPRKGYKNTKLPYPRGALGLRPELDSLLSQMV